MVDMVRPVAARPGLEDWAEITPDGVAIVDGSDHLSWSDWNQRADSLADALAGRGVAAGDVIALRMLTCWEWLVAYYAAAKLGAKVLGINWRLSIAELEFILSDSAAKVLIFDDDNSGSLQDAARAAGVSVLVSVDPACEGAEIFGELVDASSPSLRRSGQPAPLLLYTSGTTGRAKGVQTMTPPNKDALLRLPDYQRSVEGAVPRTQDDILLLTMPVHHAAGPSLVRSCVALGNKIIIMRRFEAAGAVDLIERHSVTYWSCVPTMVRRIAALEPAQYAKSRFATLRALMIGGSPVPPALKAWIVENIGEGLLHESYGSTETSMLTHLAPAFVLDKLGSSGRPYVNADLSIRKHDGGSAPAGTSGEIWARTPVTIRNYINEPPLGPDTLDENGFFRTGDVGHIDQDGFLFITGRTKDMIISGGVNLYPAEIEAAILRHPSVHDVAVIGIPDEEFGEKVLAVCELEAGASATPEEILQTAKSLIASYKMPRLLEIVEQLPRNTMGKVLKAELRAPYWEGRSTAII